MSRSHGKTISSPIRRSATEAEPACCMATL
jgi:hypothetical protein